MKLSIAKTDRGVSREEVRMLTIFKAVVNINQTINSLIVCNFDLGVAYCRQYHIFIERIFDLNNIGLSVNIGSIMYLLANNELFKLLKSLSFLILLYHLSSLINLVLLSRDY